MTQKLKVVFDTNIYLAAAINSSGPSEGWLRIAGREMRSFDLFTSDPILDEVVDKLINKFHVPPDKVKNFINGIRDVSTVVTPKEVLRVVVSDPDDNMLFECAIAAKAQLIVTADKAVLKVSPYKGVGVCHPKDLKNIFAQDLKYTQNK